MSDLGAILETGGAAAVEFAASQIAERGGKPAHCANCKEPLLGPYCAICGQPRDVHRRSVGALLTDLFKDIASFDSRILRTTRALLLEPGELVKAFREGRTQPFVPPMRLYLFVSLLFFVTLSLSHLALVQFEILASPLTVQIDGRGRPFIMTDGEKTVLPQRYADEKQHFTFNTHATFFSSLGSRHSKMSADALEIMDARMAARGNSKASWIEKTINATFHKLAVDPAALNGSITEMVPKALFALLPMFAVLTALFYWRQRREFFFVDHLVFSLNYHSFGFALALLAALAAQVLPGGLVFLGMVLLMGLYLLLAMRRVYGQSWVWTGVKFAAIGTIYSLFFLAPAFVAILALSVFGGAG